MPEAKWRQRPTEMTQLPDAVQTGRGNDEDKGGWTGMHVEATVTQRRAVPTG